MTDSIVATQVPDARRMDFWPKLVGMRFMIRVEHAVFDWMSKLSPDYGGGYWEFIELSTGGGYMVPQRVEKMRINVDGNDFAGEMSADAAGIVATLFAFSHLACMTEDDTLIQRFNDLREFAMTHAERELIFRAID